MPLAFALFDLDGVVVDSRVPISRCMNHALVAEGFDPEPEQALHRWIGPPLDQAFEQILVARGVTDVPVATLVERYRGRYAEVSLTHTEAMPGIEDALDSIGRALPIGVATAKPSEFARPILETLGLAARFKVIQGPPLTGSRSEPKSETVRRACAALGYADTPGHSPGAMVGDRDVDVEAGRANGLVTITVRWGIGDADELARAAPDHHAHTPDELARQLIQLAGSSGAGQSSRRRRRLS